MSNDIPATLTDLTFGGFDAQRSDLSIHLDIVSGLNDGKRVRGSDTIIPGFRGRIARDRKADGRDILLVGVLQGTGNSEASRLASYQNLRDAVEEAFDPEDDPATLVGKAADGTWRSIEARTAAIVWDPAPVNGVGTLSISLDSADADWQVTGGGS